MCRETALRKLSPWSALGFGAPWCFHDDLPGNSVLAAEMNPQKHQAQRALSVSWGMMWPIKAHIKAALNEIQVNNSYYLAGCLLLSYNWRRTTCLNACSFYFFLSGSKSYYLLQNFFLRTNSANVFVLFYCFIFLIFISVTFKTCLVVFCSPPKFLLYKIMQFTKVKIWFLI